MNFDSLVKQLANRINQPQVIRHYLLVVWRTALKEAEKKQLHIPVVGCSLPSKEELISVYEKTIEEKHKGLNELEKEYIKLGFMYYHRYLSDKNKK